MTAPALAGWDAVLFDLDGTLADTVELILRSYRHTMRAHLGAAPPDADWIATMGRPLAHQMRAFARDAAEAERMRATYVAHQQEPHDDLVTAYPGVREMVAELERHGTPIAVVTSKRRGLAGRTLARCGIEGAFAVTVGADDVARPKPDPEPVLAALAALGVTAPGRALLVGDSPWDVRAGRAAGTRTAAVLWGPFAREALAPERPDYVVERTVDLLAVGPPPT